IESYIAQPSEVPSNKKSVKKTVENLPNNLHFLTFPKGFKTEHFPVIEDKSFITNFIKNIKATSYDFIILNLPHQIENLFTFPIMLESDVNFNVMNLHPARILKYFQIKEMLLKTPLNFEKMKLIVNQIPESMKKENVETLLNDKCEFMIPHCPHRIFNELDLIIGSPAINESIGSYLSSIGLSDENEPEKRKKKIFGF
ncbi:MAG: hypothetical protein Q8934_22320, partial [Bacillota bacterium]|nr:hypothetical protein [Bacillota bacterium]